MLHRN